MKPKYKVNNYEVRHNALRLILNKSPKEFDKILTKLSQGKKVKLTVNVSKVIQDYDDYESEGERQAYSMYGI